MSQCMSFHFIRQNNSLTFYSCIHHTYANITCRRTLHTNIRQSIHLEKERFGTQHRWSQSYFSFFAYHWIILIRRTNGLKIGSTWPYITFQTSLTIQHSTLFIYSSFRSIQTNSLQPFQQLNWWIDIRRPSFFSTLSCRHFSNFFFFLLSTVFLFFINLVWPYIIEVVNLSKSTIIWMQLYNKKPSVRHGTTPVLSRPKIS